MKTFSVFSVLFLFFAISFSVFAADAPSWGDSGSTEDSVDSPSWDDSGSEKDSGDAPSWDDSGDAESSDDAPSWDDSGDTESSGDSPSWDDSESGKEKGDSPSWDDSKPEEDSGENPSWGDGEEKSSENEGPIWAGEKEKKESKLSDNAFKLGIHLLTFSYKKVYSPKPDSFVSLDLIKGGFLYFGYQLKKHMEFGLNVWIGGDGNDALFDGDNAFKLILAPYFQENIALTKNLSMPLQISLGFSVSRGGFEATNFIVFPSVGLQYRFNEHASFDFMFRLSYSTGKYVGKKFDYKYDNEVMTIFPTTGFTVWFQMIWRFCRC